MLGDKSGAWLFMVTFRADEELPFEPGLLIPREVEDDEFAEEFPDAYQVEGLKKL